MITFSTYDSTINSYYLAFYGRPADPSGLKFWSQALTDNNGDTSAIIQAFATSDEAQVRFGSDTLADRVTEIYQQLFNRAPDAAGLAYWTDAVEQGKASLADVAVSILKGAQSSDLDLSTMRQKAADAFTAAVENGSTEYSGYASIEAARVLVRAVTADATEVDLANLVKAVVSFADTATKNPNVVDAIATGSTLLNLYDSARGLKDPVALTQALADTAKAAAGDPVTLESLLRGGGMDKVLKVMPAKATLTDVVEALAKGGLPAAVDVVYPPVKPTPAPSTSMDLKFDSVSQGLFDTNKKDNITNVKEATVKFSYEGNDLKAGQSFQYSIDNGKTWSSKGLSADAASNTVTIEGVNLTGKQLMNYASAGFTIQGEASPVANVITQIQLQAVDASKNVFAKADAKIEYDGSAPTEYISYVGLTGGSTSSSNSAQVVTFGKLGGLGDGIVQWRLEGDSKWTVVDQFKQDGIFTLPGIDLSKAGQAVEVRVIDAAGNVGFSVVQPVSVQTDGPGDGPIGGGTPFSVTPDVAGLKIGGSVKGEVQIAEGKEIHALQISVNPDTNAQIVVAQEIARSGKVQIELANGDLVKDALNLSYTLGTNGADNALSGSFVWGFDGDDTIIGTGSDNTLIGGAGKDTIIGGLGQDMIYGGQGGDLIDLGVDNAHDRVFYEKGDAATPDFVNGASTAGIDKIKNFGGDDAIQLYRSFGNEVVKFESTYLGVNSGDHTLAVVRGLDVDGTFSAGNTAMDKDYMLQWREEGVLNSVILKDYGIEAPTLSASGKTIFHVDLPALPEPTVPTAPYIKMSKTFDGVTLDTNLSGQLESILTNGKPTYVETTEGNTTLGPGIVTLGAQKLAISGVIDLVTDKMIFNDDMVYTLGTNGEDQELTGQNVWGFDGDDVIVGTMDADFLVGGAGNDYIVLEKDGVADTIVIGAGDTLTGIFANGDAFNMDVVAYAEAGDLFKVGDVFTGQPSLIQSTYLTNAAANQVAVVRGSQIEGTFEANSSGDEFLIQWSDGKDVNSLLMYDYDGVPTLQVDAAEGTMTLVSVVGSNPAELIIPG